MKILGFELQRVTNKVESPSVVKTGQFTISYQSPVIRSRTMEDYTRALDKARSANNPLRDAIYTLYNECVDFVPHLKALIELRQLNIQAKEINYISKSGAVDEKMTEWLKAPIFKTFTKDILDTKFYGFSLFDFTKDMKDGWFDYDLIPRLHVDPIRQVVYKVQTGVQGESYNAPARLKYVMPVGDRTDLGTLKNATPIAIHLRNMTGDMMHYVELAGNNFMITKTKSNDLNIKNQLQDAFKNIGAGGNMNLPAGVTDVEIENMSSSQQNELFKAVHDILNKELSKLLLGSTMGIEDGSSLSQAEVHERTMGKVFAADEEYILDVLNYQFADYLELWGKSVDGKFEFASNVSKDALAITLGVGGTQALQGILVDQNLTPETKKEIMQVVFGLSESDAERLTISKTTKKEPKTPQQEDDTDNDQQ